MSVQKLLPIAKKMGKENFLAYKNYIKTVKSGKPATVNLNLRGMTIVDTINFTIKDGGEADIKGFRNLLREIHKTYFPRAGSKDTEKMVTLSYMPIDKETNNTKVSVKTKDNDGILGESFYHFIKMGNRIVVEAKTYCEDFKMKLDTVLNLPKNKVGKKQNLTIDANLNRDLVLKENADKIEFLLNARPNEEIPIFDVGAEISKDKLESMFGGGLESILPGLIEKSGMKFEF